ncbi:probable CCR4-associated factor 1 homolog 11 [Tanacetum coccineum]
MALRGIDFQKNLDQGIKVEKFAELLMSSGVVCNDEVTWVGFRSVFDFGYLVKMQSGKDLPDDVTNFKPLVKAYCGGTDVFDIKCLMKHCHGLSGGLDDVASKLGVKLEGTIYEQQAGANSLLTFKVFEKIKDRCLDGTQQHAGTIYGLV